RIAVKIVSVDSGTPSGTCHLVPGDGTTRHLKDSRHIVEIGIPLHINTGAVTLGLILCDRCIFTEYCPCTCCSNAAAPGRSVVSDDHISPERNRSPLVADSAAIIRHRVA